MQPLAAALPLAEGILYTSLALAALRSYLSRRRAAKPPGAGLPVLALYAAAAGGWAAAQLVLPGWQAALSPGLASRLPLHATTLLAALFLLLTRACLGQSPSGSRVWLAGAVAWAATTALLEAGTLPVPAALARLNPRAAPAVCWGTFMLGAALSTLQAYRHPQPPACRNQVVYWWLALGSLLAGGGLSLAGYPLPGEALRLGGSLLAGYTALKPRLADFRYSLRRAASFLARAALGVAVYAAGFAAAQALLMRWPGIPALLVSLAMAVVLVIVVTPLLSSVQKRLGRMIAGKERDALEVLSEYSQSIANILDLPLLVSTATGAIQKLLDVQGACLFLVDYEKDDAGRSVYRLHGVNGSGSAPPIAFDEDGPLAQRLHVERRPLTQSEADLLPLFNGISTDERAWLAGLEMEVFVPIHTKGEWTGLLAAGPQRSGAAYTGEALALLNAFASQTAVALENIRLVEGLVRLNNDFRRAYAALEQANHNLERLDRTKSDFISIASHELRTPLTLVSGSSQMLLEDPVLKENAYHHTLAGKVHTGAQRLHEIVDSMLEMAKIDTRDLQLEAQPVSIRPLVEAVAAELDKAFRERHQTFEMVGLAGLPPVSADLVALRKVFFHLLTNAIKYTPDGGRITVSGSPAYSTPEFPAGSVELVVSDTGIGIDKRQQELVFVKFYQTGKLSLHSSGKTKYKGGGAGLGLAISRGIVDAHGGKIWVESPGCDEKTCPGSQFHLILPLQQIQRHGAEEFMLSGAH